MKTHQNLRRVTAVYLLTAAREYKLKKLVTILVVEDNQTMRAGICDLLQVSEIGFEINVIPVDNGHAGLAALSQQTPDLIISDIMMPHMDGIEFVQEVRKHTEWLEIPFIFLTALGSEEDILKGRLSGADLYLTKPIDIELLLELIQNQLNRTLQIKNQRQIEKSNLQKTILQLLNHEFRTPLTYVSAYSELLEDSLQSEIDPQYFYAYLQGIQTGCLRLTRLVESFIQVIELRTGEAQQNFNQHAKPIENIVSIVQKALETALQFSEPHTAIIEQTYPSDILPIFGDSIGLITVFREILENAIKFASIDTDKKAQVHITYTQQEGFMVISIKDNGIGIPFVAHEQIFNLFYQYDRESIEQQGAGIGLSIARGIIKLHGGHIDLESQAGMGSTFSVNIPIYNPDAEKETVKPNGRIPAKILIVEDDYNLLNGLSDLLQIVDSKYHFELFVAQNGKKGLEILQNHTPHLILTDILMPVMDGYSFLKQVRQNPKWIEIPIIFLTALKDINEQHRGWRSGISEYITKPYRVDTLVSLIEKQLDRYFKIQGILEEDFETLKRNILNSLPKNMQSPLTSVSYYSNELANKVDAAKTEDALKTTLQGIRSSNFGLTNQVEDFIALAEQQTNETANNYKLHAKPIDEFANLLLQINQTLTPQQAQTTQITYLITDPLPPIFGLENVISVSLGRILDVCLQCYPPAEIKEIQIQSQVKAKEIEIHFKLNAVLMETEALRIKSILSKIDATTLQMTPYAAALRIVLGNINLHNGRFFFSNQPQAQFTVALPIYTKNYPNY